MKAPDGDWRFELFVRPGDDAHIGGHGLWDHEWIASQESISASCPMLLRSSPQLYTLGETGVLFGAAPCAGTGPAASTTWALFLPRNQQR